MSVVANSFLLEKQLRSLLAGDEWTDWLAGVKCELAERSGQAFGGAFADGEKE
jgi:hypothetical protein